MYKLFIVEPKCPGNGYRDFHSRTYTYSYAYSDFNANGHGHPNARTDFYIHTDAAADRNVDTNVHSDPKAVNEHTPTSTNGDSYCASRVAKSRARSV